jgi:transposase
MLKWVQKYSGSALEHLAFCFEHTGMYSYPLSHFLHQKQAVFYLVSGLLVKRSLGLIRGKNDKDDAASLARFAYLHQDELQPYTMPSQEVQHLKELQSFRSRLVKECAGHKAFIRERKTVLKRNDQDSLISISKKMVKVLEEKIKVIENEMISLYKNTEELNQTFQTITSIKGVGMVLATAVIVATNNFQSFNTWRQFACYAGIAPFQHQSGTSYRGKTRISTLGNRQLKTLLSQSAATAIQYNAELRLYYQKRVAEGKSKMSTLNVIRNKIVSRIFAVAKRQTPYVDTYKFAA